MQEFSNKNSRSLMTKEMERYSLLRMEEPVSLKYAYSPKGFTDSVQLLSKFPWQFFRTRKKLIFICNQKNPLQMAKVTFSKKTKVEFIKLLCFKLYYKVILMKTVWYWHKNRSTKQWNRDLRSKPIHLQPVDLR